MSREIKVRAWDQDCEVMYYSDKAYEDCYFGFNNGKVVAWLRETEHATLHEPEYSYGKPVDVEQYTGLKDKNGVEIWEDDIIKGPHDFGPGGFAERRAVVEFHAEHGYHWNYWKVDEIEVIGNRHQHPKRLEAD